MEGQKVSNIVTYAERLLEPFSQTPFTAVDSLILSWLSYLHIPADLAEAHDWRGADLYELFRAEYFERLFHGVWDEADSKRLLTAVVASPRFRGLRILGFTEQLDPKCQKQFAAVCFQLDPAQCYVAFRGTDSTLVGWKEDFNMAFQYPVPSQEEAARYLAAAAGHCTGTIRVGGHSKGGNLAVYAAALSTQAVKDRIVAAYSHDGPGFLETALESAAFRSIGDRVEKTMPQSSMVGMLLEQPENYRIVQSVRTSFWQHDPFSWVVEENDFCYLDAFTADARFFDRTLSAWLGSLTERERERFVDSLFGLVDIDSVHTFAQLRSDWQKNIPAIAHAASEMDADTKKFLGQTIRGLVALSFKNFPELFSGHDQAGSAGTP